MLDVKETRACLVKKETMTSPIRPKPHIPLHTVEPQLPASNEFRAQAKLKSIAAPEPEHTYQ